jgi:hypothetical protein
LERLASRGGVGAISAQRSQALNACRIFQEKLFLAEITLPAPGVIELALT